MAAQAYRIDGPELHRRCDIKRRQLGLSWREVGRYLDMTPSTFSRLLNEDITITGDSLVTILVWLDMDTDVAYIIRPRETPKEGAA